MSNNKELSVLTYVSFNSFKNNKLLLKLVTSLLACKLSRSLNNI